MNSVVIDNLVNQYSKSNSVVIDDVVNQYCKWIV